MIFRKIKSKRGFIYLIQFGCQVYNSKLSNVFVESNNQGKINYYLGN